MDYTSKDAFAETCGILARIEQDEAILQCEIGDNQSNKQLEKRGLAIRRLIVNSSSICFTRTRVTLCLPNDEDIPPSKISNGDVVRIKQADWDITGVVTFITRRKIKVMIDEDARRLCESDGPLTIIRLVNDTSYQRLRTALDMLPKATSRLFDVVFGLEPPILPSPSVVAGLLETTEYSNPELNDPQKQAIAFALASQDFAMIHGPPGTGKTTTVVELVHQLAKVGNRVLVLAGSNIAVDTLAEKLAPHSEDWGMVRIGHPGRVLPAISEFTLDYLIDQTESSRLSNDIRKEIADTKSWSEIRLLRKELRKFESRAVNQVMGSCSIVLSTLMGAGGRDLKGQDFDVVVIDEAAQALEIECWIGIMKAKSRVFLAGDHLQLPPTVVSAEAEERGYSKTLFERLAALNPDTVHMLSIQYRMNKEIMKWSSVALYNSRLEAHPSVASHLASEIPELLRPGSDLKAPLLLIDTSGIDEAEEQEVGDEWENQSKNNPGEAIVIGNLLERFKGYGVPDKAIGIITPYRGQVQLLRDYIGSKKVELGTVDGFQGREKEIIVLSLVRSNSIGSVGFLREIRRLNVAVTRARRLLVVVMNCSCLGSSRVAQSTPLLANFVNFCIDNASYRSGHEYLHSDGDYSSHEDIVFTPISDSNFAPEVSNNKKKMTKKERKDLRKTQHNLALDELYSKDWIVSQIQALLAGEVERFCFPVALEARHRLLVHEVAEELGLAHNSTGNDTSRYVEVSRVRDEVFDVIEIPVELPVVERTKVSVPAPTKKITNRNKNKRPLK